MASNKIISVLGSNVKLCAARHLARANFPGRSVFDAHPRDMPKRKKRRTSSVQLNFPLLWKTLGASVVMLAATVVAYRSWTSEGILFPRKPNYSCTTGSGAACRICKPQAQRTTINHCSRCNSGYGMFGTTCQPYSCSTGGGSNCLTCKPQVSRKANNHCQTCNHGYTSVNQTCQAFFCNTGTDSNCKTCKPQALRTANDHCETCNDGYDIFSTNCQAFHCNTGSGSSCKSCQPHAQRTASNHCATCNNGYAIFITTCQAFSCRTGSDSSCKSCKPQELRTTNDHCDTCNDGYAIFSTNCQAFSCITGTGSSCKTCKPQAMLTSNNQCETCNDGYVIFSTTCSPLMKSTELFADEEPSGEEIQSPRPEPVTEKDNSEPVILRPTIATVEMSTEGEPPVEVLWQRPHGKVHAVLFLAHGCKHQATDFWPTSTCPRCLGLPEELRIVRTALSRGILPVAVTSRDRGSGCWSSEDVRRVEAAIAYMYEKESLESTFRLYAFGASSGGAFVGELSRSKFIGAQKLACAIPQIMPIQQDTTQFHDGDTSWTFPPTLFIHMPRDRRTWMFVKQDLETLHGGSILAWELHCDPMPLDPVFFSSRIDGISTDCSSRLFEALREDGFLNEEGFLHSDPRMSEWRQALQKRGLSNYGSQRSPCGDSLMPDNSAINEELNVAWASHEMCATFAEKMLDFCAEPAETCRQEGWACKGGTT